MRKLRQIARPAGLLLAGSLLGAATTLTSIHLVSRNRQAPEAKSDQRPPTTATILISGEPALGKPGAPVTIVEFSDFECPYCKRFHDETFPRLKAEYIDTGLVRFIHKDLPLPFHQQAHQAAQVARCSHEQQLYWKTYSALLDKQSCLDCIGPKKIAANAGVNERNLTQCLKRGQVAKIVNTNTSEAELIGITGTPTFVIGPSQTKVHQGEILEGARPWAQFQNTIKRYLPPHHKP